MKETTNNIVTVLNEDERFAIYWCFNRAMDYVDKHSPMLNPYEDHTGKLDIIVNGVNINESIKNVLGPAEYPHDNDPLYGENE